MTLARRLARNCNQQAYERRHPIRRAAQMRADRARRRRLGLCRYCVQRAVNGRACCVFHLEYRRAHFADRQARCK